MSGRHRSIEGSDQAEHGCIGQHLIPVIERLAEGPLALDDRNEGGEYDGHPHQRGKASSEADAAEVGKRKQYGHSHAEAGEYLA